MEVTRMNKTHAAIVALLLAVAAVLGVFAASRTAGIGAAARSQASTATIAARAHRLDSVEAALRKALRDRPPALPAVPNAPTASVAPPATVYRRPAPLVVVRHTGHHEDGEGHERGDGEGGDD
jgi:hypothetical protein